MFAAEDSIVNTEGKDLLYVSLDITLHCGALCFTNYSDIFNVFNIVDEDNVLIYFCNCLCIYS